MIAAPERAPALSATLLSWVCSAAVLLPPALPGGRAPDHGPPTADRAAASAPLSAHDPRPAARASFSWEELLRDHLARYPLAQAEDVYKFTHQSVFGPAHAIPSAAEARRYLDDELASLAPGPPDEPPADRLGDDPPLVRLNLRPYVAAGGDIGALVDAFAATANLVHGDPAAMAHRLDEAVAVLRALNRAGDAMALGALAAAQAPKGFQALHHSTAYRAAYAPAYRVVSSTLLAREDAPTSPTR